jgi:TonB family protein
MKACLAAIVLASFAFAATAGAAGYQTDRGTTSFLHYNLISGSDFHYPPEARKAKLQGTGLFVMRLKADGHVDSVTIKMSSGFKILDDAVATTLRSYQFKPSTKSPILWLAGFLYPDGVLVKITAFLKETPTPARPKN